MGLLCGVLLGLRGNKLVQAGAAALGDVRQLALLTAAVFGILYGGYACSGRALEKKTGRAAQNPFEEEECIRMEFGEEEMRFSSEHFDEFARCAALTRLVHCDGHYLLFSAPAVAYAIDPKSLPAFEAFLQGKTGLTLETAR